MDPPSLLDITEVPSFFAAESALRGALREVERSLRGQGPLLPWHNPQHDADLVSQTLVRDHEAADAAKLWSQIGGEA